MKILDKSLFYEHHIKRVIEVPTGHILIIDGESGPLECLSIGDYGKEANIKADFLGLSKPITNVQHQTMMPLEEKWVITISTQYGCSMNCEFCDVPKVGPGRNASFADMADQVTAAMSLHPEVSQSKRLNLHFARMGEPSWNPNVLMFAREISKELAPDYVVHPVVSTMMPRYNKHLRVFIQSWMQFKKEYGGNAGLQLSINSTSDFERNRQFNNNACNFEEMADILKGIHPVGRKITLNFAVADYTIDPEVLLKYFSPEDYLIKLTPMHKTTKALEQGVKTDGDYTTYAPYEHHEEALRKAGYDVIVFIASKGQLPRPKGRGLKGSI